MRQKTPFIIILILFVSACQPSQKSTAEQETQTRKIMSKTVDIQGHRGCRGLLPENSIPAFIKAIDIGVTTLELDVVISKDNKVVISHEPFMSHEICTAADGSEITEENEKEYNLFQMTYEEIKACDCGSKGNARFPDQEKMSVYKPLLADMIDAVEAYTSENNLPSQLYNIETKSQPKGDNVFHPEPEAFVDLLVAVIKEKGISERTTIQSFDIRTLQVAHEKYPDIQLVLLIANEKSPQENLDELGFVPEVYSPMYQIVNKELVDFCQEKEMKLVPWTVNKKDDIQTIIDLGVDGIISDYPDRVVELMK